MTVEDIVDAIWGHHTRTLSSGGVDSIVIKSSHLNCRRAQRFLVERLGAKSGLDARLPVTFTLSLPTITAASEGDSENEAATDAEGNETLGFRPPLYAPAAPLPPTIDIATFTSDPQGRIAWSVIGRQNYGGILQIAPNVGFTSGVATVHSWTTGTAFEYAASGYYPTIGNSPLTPNTTYYFRAGSKYGPSDSLTSTYATDSQAMSAIPAVPTSLSLSTPAQRQIGWSLTGSGTAGGIIEASPASDFSSDVVTVGTWSRGDGNPATPSGVYEVGQASVIRYFRAASTYGLGDSLRTSYATANATTIVPDSSFSNTCAGAPAISANILPNYVGPHTTTVAINFGVGTDLFAKFEIFGDEPGGAYVSIPTSGTWTYYIYTSGYNCVSLAASVVATFNGLTAPTARVFLPVGEYLLRIVKGGGNATGTFTWVIEGHTVFPEITGFTTTQYNNIRVDLDWDTLPAPIGPSPTVEAQLSINGGNFLSDPGLPASSALEDGGGTYESAVTMTPSDIYRFRVRMLDGADVGPWTVASPLTIVYIPDAPEMTTLSPSARGEVTFEVTGHLNYGGQLQYDESDTFPSPTLVAEWDTGDGSPFVLNDVIEGLPDGTNLYFRTRSKYGAGDSKSAPFGTPVEIQTWPAPEAPVQAPTPGQNALIYPAIGPGPDPGPQYQYDIVLESFDPDWDLLVEYSYNGGEWVEWATIDAGTLTYDDMPILYSTYDILDYIAANETLSVRYRSRKVNDPSDYYGDYSQFTSGYRTQVDLTTPPIAQQRDCNLLYGLGAGIFPNPLVAGQSIGHFDMTGMAPTDCFLAIAMDASVDGFSFEAIADEGWTCSLYASSCEDILDPPPVAPLWTTGGDAFAVEGSGVYILRIHRLAELGLYGNVTIQLTEPE